MTIEQVDNISVLFRIGVAIVGIVILLCMARYGE